jgi:hypothetical protein
MGAAGVWAVRAAANVRVTGDVWASSALSFNTRTSVAAKLRSLNPTTFPEASRKGGRAQRLRRYVARGQKQARGGGDFLAPATAKKIRQRDRAFRMLVRLPEGAFIRYMSTKTAAAIKLPDY